jgi:hypothetical protein
MPSPVRLRSSLTMFAVISAILDCSWFLFARLARGFLIFG